MMYVCIIFCVCFICAASIDALDRWCDHKEAMAAKEKESSHD